MNGEGRDVNAKEIVSLDASSRGVRQKALKKVARAPVLHKPYKEKDARCLHKRCEGMEKDARALGLHKPCKEKDARGLHKRCNNKQMEKE